MGINCLLFILIASGILLFVNVIQIFWYIINILICMYNEYTVRRGNKTRVDLVESNFLYLARELPFKETMNHLFISTSKLQQPQVLDSILQCYSITELERMICYIKKDKKKREKTSDKKIRRTFTLLSEIATVSGLSLVCFKPYLEKIFNELKNIFYSEEVGITITVIISVVVITIIIKVVIKKIFNKWLDKYLNHDYLINVIENEKQRRKTI